MSQSGGVHGERPGPIAYMAGNGVAANLLAVAIVAAGLVSLNGITLEAWPTLPFNRIEVSVAYPGATPDEVEESIVVKIEEQVSSLDDVKGVKSLASPGIASVRVELRDGTDIDRALDDIKAAVGRIQSFPASSERPAFREMTNRQSIMRLIVYGDVSERALKELAHRIEDELAALPDVSDVKTSGVRDYEVSIEVPLHRLRALELTLQDISDAIRRGSLDLSAGSIDTQEAQVRVRTLGRHYDQQDFEDIIVLARADGTVVRLGDIAHVRDDFQKVDLLVRHQGQPAAFVEVYRAQGEQVATVASAVRAYLDNELIPSLPDGVGITVWNDDSELFGERVDLLVKNGSLGLLLVFLALALFLEIRLALWVAFGLAVAAIGTLAVVLALDLPINSNGLFAFVLAIGIVVDDAIVVSEHIHHERKLGASGIAAAIRGTRRIQAPLIFAVLTSVAAFSPLLFLPGGIGEILAPVPIILISMLLISLVESMLVLPNHLTSLPGPEWRPTNFVYRFFWWAQSGVDRSLKKFISGPLDRWLRFATEQPVVVIAGAIGMLVLTVSLLPAGIVGTTFADKVEGDFVTVSLEMPDGTPAQRTYEVALQLEAAGHRVIERFTRDRPEDAPPLLSGVTVIVGQRARVEGGGLVPQPSVNPESNIATVEFKLLGAQHREVATGTVLEAWRDEVGFLPYARGVTFASEIIALGNPVEIVLSHPDPGTLVAAADSVLDVLQGFQGVFDIRSDHAPGVKEIQLELRPEARTLGLTLESMARQARAAFFGEEALRVQRGRDEVRVYVRLPDDERNAITDVEEYLIRTPGRAEVPLSQVASLSLGTSPLAIRRKDGQRVVTVTADVDSTEISGPEVTDILAQGVLAELTAADPDLTYTLGGEAQQQFESFDSLTRSFILAMLVIFALLAIPLRSYTKPLIIMAVIPFGLVGAILGHLIMGIEFSFTSAMGFVGLSGVVVNDSLVMIDFIDERLRGGDLAKVAIIEGAKGRFRAIMLTSLTTFLGFTPLILERAIHAKFLVPFAASLGFGILVTTAVLMMVVPALTSIHLRKMMPRGEATSQSFAYQTSAGQSEEN